MSTSIQIQSSGGSSIAVVANYSALPTASTVTGQFYWCSNSQGTSWLPGPLGGTYYPNGMYYSNGTTWEFIDVPYQASQVEVDAGTVTDKFVTPKTFNDSSQLANKVPTSRNLTINGVTQDLSADRTFTVSSSDFRIMQAADTSPVTGVSGSDVLIYSEIIPANTFTNNSFLEIKSCKFKKTGTAGNNEIRIWINTINSLSGATRLATYAMGSVNTYVGIQRIFSYDGTSLVSILSVVSLLNDYQQLNAGDTSTAVNKTVDNYIIISVRPGSVNDSIVNYGNFFEICGQ